jgi:hypothetical protein
MIVKTNAALSPRIWLMSSSSNGWARTGVANLSVLRCSYGAGRDEIEGSSQGMAPA